MITLHPANKHKSTKVVCFTFIIILVFIIFCILGYPIMQKIASDVPGDILISYVGKIGQYIMISILSIGTGIALKEYIDKFFDK